MPTPINPSKRKHPRDEGNDQPVPSSVSPDSNYPYPKPTGGEENPPTTTDEYPLPSKYPYPKESSFEKACKDAWEKRHQTHQGVNVVKSNRKIYRRSERNR